jgi:methyl-accepting chemotaxis protein
MANMPQQEKRFTQDAEHLKDDVKDMATGVMDKAKEIGANVGDKAKEIASAAGQKANNLTSRVGSGMESLGESIREHSPHAGTAGAVASRVAENLERGGRYVREKEIGGMANDLTDVIRRNPVPAILIGVGLGYLIARAIRR